VEERWWGEGGRKEVAEGGGVGSVWAEKEVGWGYG